MSLCETEIMQPPLATVYTSSGTLTILQGQNSITFPHGLGRIPVATVGPTNDTGTTWYFTVDATNLKIYLSGGGLALQNCTFMYILA